MAFSNVNSETYSVHSSHSAISDRSRKAFPVAVKTSVKHNHEASLSVRDSLDNISSVTTPVSKTDEYKSFPNYNAGSQVLYD